MPSFLFDGHECSMRSGGSLELGSPRCSEAIEKERCQQRQGVMIMQMRRCFVRGRRAWRDMLVALALALVAFAVPAEMKRRGKRAPATKDAESEIEQAFRLHQAGHFSEAAAQYRHAIAALRQRSPADVHRLALCAHNLGFISDRHLHQPDQAKHWFQEAVRMRPDYFEAFHNLGQSLKDAGKYSEAIDAFRREQHLRPDLSAPLLAIAQCFHELGDIDSAAGEAIAASELDPSSTSAWNGAGWFLHLAGKSSAARDMLKRGLRLHPGNAAMYMHLGKALSDLGELGEAAAAPQHATCS